MAYKPIKGTTKQHILAIEKELQSLQISGDGKTILVQKDPTGTRLQVIPQSKNIYNTGKTTEVVSTSEDVVVCEITGGNAQLGYNVNIFGNGPQNAYTATGKLYATEIAYGSTLPTGTRIIGHKVAMTITGGTA